MKEELLLVRRSFNGLPSGRLGRSGWTLGRNCWGDSWNLKTGAAMIPGLERGGLRVGIRVEATPIPSLRDEETQNPWSRILESWNACKSLGSEHPASAQP
jgi:hypothetical protein